MFVLVELRDTVTIAPSQFHRKMQDAVTYALNKKFANKVSNCVVSTPCLKKQSKLFLL